jgi:hypothetical protein
MVCLTGELAASAVGVRACDPDDLLDLLRRAGAGHLMQVSDGTKSESKRWLRQRV